MLFIRRKPRGCFRACPAFPAVVYCKYAMGREMKVMARFIPRDKLSKKAQRELNRQRRVTWDFSPVTKTVDSRKLYNRKRIARDRYDSHDAGVSSLSA